MYGINKTKRNNFNELLEYLANRKVSWSSFRGIGSHIPGQYDKKQLWLPKTYDCTTSPLVKSEQRGHEDNEPREQHSSRYVLTAVDYFAEYNIATQANPRSHQLLTAPIHVFQFPI